MAYYSKIYANVIAKYDEGRLLSGEKLRRIAEADFADAVKMLADYGYGGGIASPQSYDADAFITAETARLIEFVKEDCPGEELKNCLLNRFYYSDAKVYYKRKFVNIDPRDALYGCFPELEKAVDSGDYSALPPFLADAYKELNEKSLERVPPPKEIDAVLTRALCADNVYNAKKSRNRALIKYVAFEIDFNNILTVYRFKKLGLDPETLSGELFAGGALGIDALTELYCADPQKNDLPLLAADYAETVEKLAQTGDFTLAVRDSQDALYAFLAGGGENMLSLSPFINYFLARMNELRTIKTVLVCLKNNARDEIPRRVGSFNYD
ncbi:MAG: V-type ATPase subunit [Clostridiales bacterium]|jgi:vacuolar-type H+-ATPase subunit C/Vma6|nr:V-type ATPase subunit [Clostridiales bacterium]